MQLHPQTKAISSDAEQHRPWSKTANLQNAVHFKSWATRSKSSEQGLPYKAARYLAGR
jgi:hypothetical protein